jgi:SAM-dependent methyltransferase
MCNPTPRLYAELSWLWPLWGEIEEYRAETEALGAVARRRAVGPVRTLLDVGCGGGKNLRHFRQGFEATGLDRSEAMLARARELNPDTPLICADMRDFNLGRTFDAIYLNDALPHLTSRVDLARACACASRHLRPGGVLLAVAEFTQERFCQNATKVTAGRRHPALPEVIFIENLYDPDPSDETFEATILYLIRESGRLRIERDDWLCGLFPFSAWTESLAACGLNVAVETALPEFGDLPLLVGTKPG